MEAEFVDSPSACFISIRIERSTYREVDEIKGEKRLASTATKVFPPLPEKCPIMPLPTK